MTDRAATDPFALVFELDALSRARAREIRVEADAAARRRIAESLELHGVERFTLTGALTPHRRRGWRFEGRLRARYAQICGVTLEPAPGVCDEELMRVWLPSDEIDTSPDVRIAGFGADGAPVTDDEEEPEALSDPLDLSAMALEALALALDPYPRAPGAALDVTSAAPPGVAPLDDAALKPFAGLAELQARLSTAEQEGPKDAPDAAASDPTRRKREDDA